MTRKNAKADFNAIPFKQLIENIDRKIIAAKGQSLDFTVLILSMTRLELLVREHGVSDKELKALCDTIDTGNLGMARNGDGTDERARRLS
jgi:hypothetical protein